MSTCTSEVIGKPSNKERASDSALSIHFYASFSGFPDAFKIRPIKVWAGTSIIPSTAFLKDLLGYGFRAAGRGAYKRGLVEVTGGL